MPGESSLKDKLDLLCKGAKTLALRAAIGKKLEGRIERESVEIYLYYEAHLQSSLLTAIKTTTYGNRIGKRSWIKEEDLEKEIEKTYPQYLLDLPPFTQLFQVDSKLVDAKEETLNKELEDLEEQVKKDQIQEAVYLEAAASRPQKLVEFKAEHARKWVEEQLGKDYEL